MTANKAQALCATNKVDVQLSQLGGDFIKK